MSSVIFRVNIGVDLLSVVVLTSISVRTPKPWLERADCVLPTTSQKLVAQRVLLDALEIERTHFCGLSIGGLTGQWLGIHAGHRLDRIIMCATSAKIGTAEGWLARMESVRENGLSGLIAATAERWFTPKFGATEPDAVRKILDNFAATAPDGYIGCCAALAEADLWEEIERIVNPLLAISGEDDPVCRRPIWRAPPFMCRRASSLVAGTAYRQRGVGSGVQCHTERVSELEYPRSRGGLRRARQ